MTKTLRNCTEPFEVGESTWRLSAVSLEERRGTAKLPPQWRKLTYEPDIPLLLTLNRVEYRIRYIDVKGPNREYVTLGMRRMDDPSEHGTSAATRAATKMIEGPLFRALSFLSDGDIITYGLIQKALHCAYEAASKVFPDAIRDAAEPARRAMHHASRGDHAGLISVASGLPALIDHLHDLAANTEALLRVRGEILG